VTTPDAPIANASDIQDPAFFVETPGTVPVVIKRDSGFVGSACSHQIFIQGKRVAKLKSSHKITIYLKPGTYVISVAPTGMCASNVYEAEARVAVNDPPTYRISMTGSGNLSISRTAF
jgi:hypothetical protein